MGDALAERIAGNMDKHLGEYRDLISRRLEIESRLERARREKDSVKESIFKRVCTEYQEELKKLEESVQPIRDQVDKFREEIKDGRSDIDREIKHVEEQIEEIEFRRRVGEFTDKIGTEREKPLRDRIGQLNKQAADLRVLLSQIEEAERGEAAAAEPSLDSMADPEAAVTGEDNEIDLDEGDKDVADKTDDTRAAAAAEKPNTVASDKTRTVTAEKPKTVATEKPKTVATEKPKTVAAEKPKTVAAEKPNSEVKESLPAAKKDERPGEPGPEQQGAKEKAQGASPTDDVIDTSGWAEELREDLLAEAKDRSVFLHGRRATDRRVSKADTEPLPRPAPNPSAQANRNDASGGFPNLVIIKGPGAGKKLPLVPVTMTIGREHDNNIELKDEEVARYHARLSFKNGAYHIEDLESSSGTWVNGEPVTEAALKHGDKITVGSTDLMMDFD